MIVAVMKKAINLLEESSFEEHNWLCSSFAVVSTILISNLVKHIVLSNQGDIQKCKPELPVNADSKDTVLFNGRVQSNSFVLPKWIDLQNSKEGSLWKNIWRTETLAPNISNFQQQTMVSFLSHFVAFSFQRSVFVNLRSRIEHI